MVAGTVVNLGLPCRHSVSENYLLYVPIRLTMAEMVRVCAGPPCHPVLTPPLQLFRKVLRARDAKSSEAQGGGAGRGRSQVRCESQVHHVCAENDRHHHPPFRS